MSDINDVYKYLDLYHDTDELISIFEITLEIFSKEIPDEILKDNDFESIINDFFE